MICYFGSVEVIMEMDITHFGFLGWLLLVIGCQVKYYPDMTVGLEGYRPYLYAISPTTKDI